MKGCIRHSAKWQIHPFIFKGRNNYIYGILAHLEKQQTQYTEPMLIQRLQPWPYIQQRFVLPGTLLHQLRLTSHMYDLRWHFHGFWRREVETNALHLYLLGNIYDWGLIVWRDWQGMLWKKTDIFIIDNRHPGNKIHWTNALDNVSCMLECMDKCWDVLTACQVNSTVCGCWLHAGTYTHGLSQRVRNVEITFSVSLNLERKNEVCTKKLWRRQVKHNFCIKTKRCFTIIYRI